MTATTDDRILSVEELFDDIGPAYESAFANLVTQNASIEWLLLEIENKKPADVLDIGCGTGRPVCAALATAGHRVRGIDISGAMIAAARSNVRNAHFEKIDTMHYEPGEGSFDAITAYFSMMGGFTQEQIKELIKKIYSWLRPKGLLVFATVPIDGDDLGMEWLGRKSIASSLTVPEAVQAVRDAGFEVIFQDESRFLPKAVEAGICEAKDVFEEPHLFVYARK